MNDDGYLLSAEAVRKISAIAKQTAIEVTGQVKRGRGPTVIQPTRYAVVTTVITACSGTTLGVGKGNIYCVTSHITGATEVIEVGATILNWYTSSIGIGTHIIVGTVDGFFGVLGSDCPGS